MALIYISIFLMKLGFIHAYLPTMFPSYDLPIHTFAYTSVILTSFLSYKGLFSLLSSEYKYKVIYVTCVSLFFLCLSPYTAFNFCFLFIFGGGRDRALFSL